MDTPSLTPAPTSNPLSRRDCYFLFLLTLLAALLNTAKPMIVDDAPYLTQAIQTAQHPLDPFGYTYTVAIWPESGLNMPAPPVFLYYLALGVKLLGDTPALLKLWVIPWFFLLAWSCLKLLKPWAGPWSLLAVGTLLLGPTFLPSINLMLDIPVAALTVAGIALLRDYLDQLPQSGCHGSDSDQTRVFATPTPSKLTLLLALLALALAPLVKYTGISAPAAGFLLCLLHRRYALAALTGLITTAFFVGWESFVYSIYHITHMGYQTAAMPRSLNPLPLVQSLFTLTWSMSPFLLPLAGIALGFGARVWAPLAILSLALYAALATFDVPDFIPCAGSALIWLTILWCAITSYLKRPAPHSDSTNPTPSTWDIRIDGFLIAWLALELSLMFIISPFPASRRLIGGLLVATFILARAAGRNASSAPSAISSPGPSRLATASLLAGSLIVSLTFYASDWLLAKATPTALAQFAAQPHPPDTRLYVFGRWTVPYFAPRMGLSEITLDQTQLNPGDQVLIVTAGMYMPPYTIDPQALSPQETISPTTSPIETAPTFGGPLGLRHTRPTGIGFTRYLVTQPTIIRSNPSEPFMRRALLARKIPPLPLASWSLVDYAMKEQKPFDNDFSQKLLLWGDPFLARALDHPTPQARAWTIILLAQHPQSLTPPLLEKIATLKSDPSPQVRNLAQKLTGP